MTGEQVQAFALLLFLMALTFVVGLLLGAYWAAH